MKALCTSFLPAPRRIVRSRAARVLVWALALVLTAANIGAAAMPLSPASSAPHATQSLAHTAHCADHGAAAAHKHHGAGTRDCACCVAGACACVQACDVPVFAVVAAPAPLPARTFALLPPRDYFALETRPLRPPIG